MVNIIKINPEDIKKVHIPKPDSHKGQNGRLLVIGGSHLFHAASLWALTVASRIVDLVHYCSVQENNQLVKELKSEFRNGIVVDRVNVESYVREDDCILIGPGMVRVEGISVTSPDLHLDRLDRINSLADDGVQTAALSNYLVSKYPSKKWVIDAGSLQMIDPRLIPASSILTPHWGEFERLEQNCLQSGLMPEIMTDEPITQRVINLARILNTTIVLKGRTDIIASPEKARQVAGGNAGMTKGGTGDVLSGLIAALATKNDLFTAACIGSYINKKAGDRLYKKVGIFFNATDLSEEIPRTMKDLLL